MLRRLFGLCSFCHIVAVVRLFAARNVIITMRVFEKTLSDVVCNGANAAWRLANLTTTQLNNTYTRACNNEADR
jgi:hypothetical protein